MPVFADMLACFSTNGKVRRQQQQHVTNGHISGNGEHHAEQLVPLRGKLKPVCASSSYNGSLCNINFAVGNGVDAAGGTSLNGLSSTTANGTNEYRRFETKMNAVREQWERDQQQQSNGNATIVPGASNDASTAAIETNGHASVVGTTATSSTLNNNRQRIKRSFHVRALFDYDPSKDSNLPNRGLPFCFGDILHVINATDDEWWQAKRVNTAADNAEEGLGIIPSRQTSIGGERGTLAGGDASASSSLHAAGGQSKKSLSFSRKLGLASRAANKDNNNHNAAAGDSSTAINSNTATAAAAVAGTTSDDQDSIVHVSGGGGGASSSNSSTTVLHIKSYEPVSLQKVVEPRPLVVFGLLKDRVNEDLTTQFPERFAQCVPHTTRPKRDSEVEGKDYHFVQSREQMERDIQSGMFIEAGQYNDNLYGTSVKAVKEIAMQGKHCVLDVNGPALRRLRASGFSPIVVAIRPKSVENIIELNKRMSQEQAIREFERARKLDDEYGHLFTAIVQGDSLDELYAQVKDIIVRESSEQSWLPSNEKI